MTTGDRIRELRLALSMTQKELGDLVGVQKAAINKYETGIVVNIKRDTIDELAKALHTTPAYLLGYEEQPSLHIDMDDISARLLETIQKRQMTYGDLATKTGIAKSAIQRYATGETKKIPLPRLEALADALDVSAAYLMGWDDASSSRPLPAGLLPVVKRRIPILGHVAAGVPIMAEREYEEYEADTYGLSCDCVLRVEGDSMEPRVMNGDIVYVRQQPDVDDGQIAVVGVNDSVTLKVVYHLPNGLQLVSLNPKYKPMIYNQENTDYLAVIGLAVAYKRRL